MVRAATHYHTCAWANIKTQERRKLYRHCYILRVLAVANIEIRKIDKSYHFKIEIKIQTFESSEEVKSVRRYHTYMLYRMTSFSDDI